MFLSDVTKKILSFEIPQSVSIPVFTVIFILTFVNFMPEPFQIANTYAVPYDDVGKEITIYTYYEGKSYPLFRLYVIHQGRYFDVDEHEDVYGEQYTDCGSISPPQDFPMFTIYVKRLPYLSDDYYMGYYNAYVCAVACSPEDVIWLCENYYIRDNINDERLWDDAKKRNFFISVVDNKPTCPDVSNVPNRHPGVDREVSTALWSTRRPNDLYPIIDPDYAGTGCALINDRNWRDEWGWDISIRPPPSAYCGSSLPAGAKVYYGVLFYRLKKEGGQYIWYPDLIVIEFEYMGTNSKDTDELIVAGKRCYPEEENVGRQAKDAITGELLTCDYLPAYCITEEGEEAYWVTQEELNENAAEYQETEGKVSGDGLCSESEGCDTIDCGPCPERFEIPKPILYFPLAMTVVMLFVIPANVIGSAIRQIRIRRLKVRKELGIEEEREGGE